MLVSWFTSALAFSACPRVCAAAPGDVASLEEPSRGRPVEGSTEAPADHPTPTSSGATNERPRSFTLWAGGAVASVLDTGAGAVPALGGQLAGTFPLGRLFALELQGSAGISAKVDTEPSNAWLRLALGLRLERTDAWGFRPYVAARIVHIHFAPSTTWRDYPGDSLLGSSSRGLEHRSGLGVGLGFSYGLGRSPFRVFADLEPSWVPIGDGPKLFAVLASGVAVAL